MLNRIPIMLVNSLKIHAVQLHPTDILSIFFTLLLEFHLYKSTWNYKLYLIPATALQLDSGTRNKQGIENTYSDELWHVTNTLNPQPTNVAYM
jgi:hypothetical protein